MLLYKALITTFSKIPITFSVHNAFLLLHITFKYKETLQSSKALMQKAVRIITRDIR